MKKICLAVLIALAFAGVAETGRAQVPAAGPPGWNAALTKLFGDIKAFTAMAEMCALDKGGRETLRMSMGFALLDDKVRMDIDMAQMKGPQVPAGAAAQMKQMGMDRMAVLFLQDKKTMQVIYPGLQAYVDMPMPDDTAARADNDFKIVKTRLGNETVDGHPCVKHKVVMTGAKSQKAEAVVWNASDLRDFPVQMQMNDQEATIVMRYKEVKLAKPEARRFDPPAGYTKHSDVQQLMMAVAQKKMGAQSRKK